MYTKIADLCYKIKRSEVWERPRSNLSCLLMLATGQLPVAVFTNHGTNQKGLGNRIRELRKQRGLSQIRFARRCGLHPSYMGEIERGETNLTLTSLILITKRLQTTIAQLFDGLG